MSTYRSQVPRKYVDWLTAPGGTLGDLADQVRDAETDPDRGYEPGWTYFDGSVIDRLRELPEYYDGCVSDDDGLRIWFEGTPYDLLPETDTWWARADPKGSAIINVLP